ncbi:polyketide synthase [Aspergillus luchuensis]|uniref:Polyketide synthase n=1 Tax=Aspergillus kawachii TaxID=1069201 RepID=A0A146G0R9_ASPKA|nr:polyketide synthase [Aspergillus luchuensis]
MTVRQDAAVAQKPLEVAAEGVYLAADDRKDITPVKGHLHNQLLLRDHPEVVPQQEPGNLLEFGRCRRPTADEGPDLPTRPVPGHAIR